MAKAKKHNFEQILKFAGLLYRPPFTDEGQMKFNVLEQTHGIYADMPNFVWIGLFCRPLSQQTPNFAVLDFGILWCRQLAAI